VRIERLERPLEVVRQIHVARLQCGERAPK